MTNSNRPGRFSNAINKQKFESNLTKPSNTSSAFTFANNNTTTTNMSNNNAFAFGSFGNAQSAQHTITLSFNIAGANSKHSHRVKGGCLAIITNGAVYFNEDGEVFMLTRPYASTNKKHLMGIISTGNQSIETTASYIFAEAMDMDVDVFESIDVALKTDICSLEEWQAAIENGARAFSLDFPITAIGAEPKTTEYNKVETHNVRIYEPRLTWSRSSIGHRRVDEFRMTAIVDKLKENPTAASPANPWDSILAETGKTRRQVKKAVKRAESLERQELQAAREVASQHVESIDEAVASVAQPVVFKTAPAPVATATPVEVITEEDMSDEEAFAAFGDIFAEVEVQASVVKSVVSTTPFNDEVETEEDMSDEEAFAAFGDIFVTEGTITASVIDAKSFTSVKVEPVVPTPVAEPKAEVVSPEAQAIIDDINDGHLLLSGVTDKQLEIEEVAVFVAKCKREALEAQIKAANDAGRDPIMDL